MSAVSDLFTGLVERIDVVSLPESTRRMLERLADPEVRWSALPNSATVERVCAAVPVTRAEIEAAFRADGIPPR